MRIPNAWPDGTYALPRHKRGCPKNGDPRQFPWEEGWRYQDSNSGSWYSNHLLNYLDATVGRDGVKTKYCTKTVKSSDYKIRWPMGSYCLYKKGVCPAGFEKSSIYWDDVNTNNGNRKDGILPDGVYDGNTRIYFCCRNDRHPHHEIMLPTDGNWFLIRQHPEGCQRVMNMKVKDHWVWWDDQSSGDSSTGKVKPYDDSGTEGYPQDHRIHFCHYSKSS